MPREAYPLFREYSLAVRDWLRSICILPRFERMAITIDKILINGTTSGGIRQSEIHLTTTKHEFKIGHPIVIEGSSENAEYYVVKAVSGNVLILDMEYRRLRVNEDFSSINDPLKPVVKRTINIVYGSMERSIAQIAQPLRNGTIDSPGVSFFISDYQFKVEKSRPRENYYTRRHKDNHTGAIQRVNRVPPMLEYMIHYNVNIWSVYAQELDILQYQIVADFNPEKYFWIGDPDYGFNFKGDRSEREHKGQWAHSLIDVIADVSDLEPGDATNRTLRYEVGFMINNAYLPQPFEYDQAMIGSIDLENIVEE